MGLVKEVIKEIGNKSREFYEFVLPPVDMYLDETSLKVIIDIPGFEKKNIQLTLCGDILSIKAHKQAASTNDNDGNQKELDNLISNQRPNIIDKKIRLPIDIKQGEEKIDSAKYDNGTLTLVIPVTKKGKNISIE